MPPRPRKKGHKDLPKNVYPNTSKGRTYYRWRNPITGIFTGIGPNKATAIDIADQLTAAIRQQQQNAQLQKLISAATAPATQQYTWHKWLARYLQIFTERGGKPGTQRIAKSNCNALRRGIPDKPLTDVTVADLSAIVSSYIDKNQQRQAHQLRARMIDVFREAKTEGAWPDTRDNPASITRTVKVQVKRARLTLEQFHVILQSAKQQIDISLYQAMLLSFISGQPREVIHNLKFKHATDGYLHITREKTGAKIRLPLQLKQATLDLTMADHIKQCRKGPLSPWIIHHHRNTNKSKAGDQIHIDTLSRRFRDARAASGLTWPDHTPPTFHEIRSLAVREHGKTGLDVQTLCGHKDASTTEIYKDNRGAEWMELKL